MTNKKTRRPAGPAGTVSVPSDQGVVRVPAQALPYLPTKPSKALVAAVVTLAGLVGIHLTTGTAQLVVMAVQLLAVVFGVWRARNTYKATGGPGPGVGDYL
jgi:hypothetical protein